MKINYARSFVPIRSDIRGGGWVRINLELIFPPPLVSWGWGRGRCLRAWITVAGAEESPLGPDCRRPSDSYANERFDQEPTNTPSTRQFRVHQPFHVLRRSSWCVSSDSYVPFAFLSVRYKDKVETSWKNNRKRGLILLKAIVIFITVWNLEFGEYVVHRN